MSDKKSRPDTADGAADPGKENPDEESITNDTNDAAEFLGHGAGAWFEVGGEIVRVDDSARDVWRVHVENCPHDVYTSNPVHGVLNQCPDPELDVIEVRPGDEYAAAIVRGCVKARRRPEIEIGGTLHADGWPGDVEITYTPPFFSATADPEELSSLERDIVDIDALQELQSPPPLIADVLFRETYAIVSGRDRSLKSFLALDWSLCLATGTPWHGHEVQRVPVLFIAGEGLLGIHRRVAAWTEHHGVEVEPGMFRVLKRPTNLHTGHEMAALVDHVQRHNYGLVVLDTLRKMSGAASENDASDMAVIISNILELKRATDSGSILVVAHTAKTDLDTRGSSSIEDDADSVWHLRWEPGEKSVVARCRKQKDAEDGASFRLEPLPVGDSIVLQRTDLPVDPRDLVGEEYTALIELLDQLGVPRDAGVRPCGDALRAAGKTVSSAVLRVVVKLRKASS